MDKKKSVLLVDDELDFAQAMSKWFESRGYSVKIITNGKEALKAIKDHTPDCVFLDIVLPDIDGYMVLKEIRESNKTLPIIMMSAYVKDVSTEQKVNIDGYSGIFYKEEGFLKALALFESALKGS